MQTTTIDADFEGAARAFIVRVAGRHDLAGAILFGSRARGDHRPESDVDSAVLLRGSRGNFLNTKLSPADISYDVRLETGILIEPLPIGEEEWGHPARSPTTPAMK